jgi:RNA polymerase sigma factor (sigma-70 family)
MRGPAAQRDEAADVVRPYDEPETRATIFLRLNDHAPRVREVAWEEFHARYAPLVQRFARSIGAPVEAAEAAVQEVMVGFFSASPTFTYDPSKGRFRGYLMRCTANAVRRQWRERARGGRAGTLPLDWDERDPRIVEAWEKAWQRERLRRVMEVVAQRERESRPVLAFRRVVIDGESPGAVAGELGIGVNAVHQARCRVGQMLRQELAEMAEEGW